MRVSSPFVGGVPPALLLVLVCSCHDGSSGSDPDPCTATVQIEDRGPISRSLTVTLCDPGPVRVEYWTEGQPHLNIDSPAATERTHEIPLTRLRAESQYRFVVHSRPAALVPDPIAAGTFATEALPDDLRGIAFEATGTPGQALTFVSVGTAFSGGVILDAEGQVVWFARTPAVPQAATRRPNGNWVLATNGAGLFQFSVYGELIESLLPADIPGNARSHHGVCTTPSDTLLFLAFDPRIFAGETLNGESIWEWNPKSGTVTKRWSAFDFLDPTVDSGPRSGPGDWFHANSISIGPRGNVLVSFHYLDQIISIAPGFGSIEWRLGGAHGSFHLRPDQQSSGQHSAWEVAPGHVLMFDNGYQRIDGQKYSRALELALDPTTGSVSTAWEYRPNPDIWSVFISSARRSATGNTTVVFGTPQGLSGSTGPVAIHEVSPAGALVWSVRIGLPPTGIVFEGHSLASIAGEY